MAPLQNLHIRIHWSSRSTAIPNPSIDLSYFASATTQDLTDVSDLVNKITTAFGTTPAGGLHSLNANLGSVLSSGANNSKWEVYDVTTKLNGQPAGSPVLLGSWTATGVPATTGSPEACAAVVTMQAPYGTDVEFAPGSRPRARDRGRVYIGPINLSLGVSVDTNGRNFLTSQFRTDVLQTFKAINVITTAPHSIPYNLCVWSRKNGIMKSLQEVWMDDRVDYRRQRAGIATTKTIVGLP